MICCFVLTLVWCGAARSAFAESPLLQPGDRLAIVGGTFVERMQESAAVEAELQCRRPDWELSVRNLGWSGDDVHGIARKRFDGPEDGYQRLLRDVETAEADVVLLAYGFSEAADGTDAVQAFAPGLRKLAEQLRERGRRVILMPPLEMPGIQVADYQRDLETCRASVRAVAGELDLPLIWIEWTPSDTELTADRLLPNQAGYAALAGVLADALVGGQPCADVPTELLRRVELKNELFFHHYRPQNETYLFLFRKHEQGNNAVEIDQFKPLIKAADEAIWAAAEGI